MSDGGGLAATDVFSRVNAAQRDCLKLVMQHKTSKDIARELGISPHTVDMRLRKAMVILGVDNRMAAARLLADAEDTIERHQRLIYQSHDLPKSPFEAEIAAVELSDRVEPHQGVGALKDTDQQITENRTLPIIDKDRFASDEKYLVTLAKAVSRGRRNNLSIGARLVLIVLIAIGSAIAFGVLVSALESLRRIL